MSNCCSVIVVAQSLHFYILFLLLLALSMRVVFSPNGAHPFDMRDFRVLAPRVLAGGFAVATHLPSKSFASIGLLGYGGLLSCVGIISRFGRQARLGERGDLRPDSLSPHPA